MKTQPIHLFSLLILLFSCRKAQENKLEKQFEKHIVKKEFVKRIEVESTDTSAKDTMNYYIGYDNQQRIINNANSDFYEYDSNGRVIKRFKCWLERDPNCNKPYIYLYEYSNNRLASIKFINSSTGDNIASVFETFKYDSKNRLIEHTKFPTDTFSYSYERDDTSKHSELWTYWVNTIEDTSKFIRVSITTTFQYNNVGKKISSTSITDDNLSMRNEFFYDNKNRIIMQRDTSLVNFTVREPNSCCILYWTEYKYDDQDRIIEELHSVGTNDNPKQQFQRKTVFQY